MNYELILTIAAWWLFGAIPIDLWMGKEARWYIRIGVWVFWPVLLPAFGFLYAFTKGLE